MTNCIAFTRALLRPLARVAAPALLAATLATGGAFAHDSKTVGDITVSGAWTRATPPRAKAGGAFLKIENAGSTDDRLVSASAPVSARTEIHEMAVTDGIMTMREMKDGIVVPAGATVELKPGGYHVMFLDLTQPMKQDENVPVTLTFEKAGEVTLNFKVERIGAKGPEHCEAAHGGSQEKGAMDHGTMDHSNMDHSNMGHSNMGHGTMSGGSNN
jgi:copper(I)-binding protein